MIDYISPTSALELVVRLDEILSQLLIDIEAGGKVSLTIRRDFSKEDEIFLGCTKRYTIEVL